MSDEHVLRDRSYKVIGRIRTINNGDREIRDTVNHRLGHYDVDRDMTFDAIGRVVGRGDLLTTLLPDND
jgi:hypothetical protein